MLPIPPPQHPRTATRTRTRPPSPHVYQINIFHPTPDAQIKIRLDASANGCSGMFWRSKPDMNASVSAPDWPRNGAVFLVGGMGWDGVGWDGVGWGGMGWPRDGGLLGEIRD